MTDLYTEKYASLLQKSHETESWGKTAQKYVEKIAHYADALGETNLLDYGAGRGALKKYLPKKYAVTEYEPARTSTRKNNTPHNYVVCIDVLEHVEPELIENVLDDLKRVTLVGGYFTISTRAAKRILSDGRNAHLIIEPVEWWEEKLSQRFSIEHKEFDIEKQRGEFFVIPLPSEEN